MSSDQPINRQVLPHVDKFGQFGETRDLGTRHVSASEGKSRPVGCTRNPGNRAVGQRFQSIMRQRSNRSRISTSVYVACSILYFKQAFEEATYYATCVPCIESYSCEYMDT